jgi:hypothetical protein
MDNQKESLLNLNFLHSDKLKTRDSEQIRRIEKKILTFYELKYGNLFRTESKNKLENFKEENLTSENKNTQLINKITLDKNFINKEIKQNTLFGIISICSYVYFTRFSKILSRTNSVALFRPLFLFTFCAAPVIISLYFTKLDVNLHKSELTDHYESI